MQDTRVPSRVPSGGTSPGGFAWLPIELLSRLPPEGHFRFVSLDADATIVRPPVPSRSNPRLEMLCWSLCWCWFQQGVGAAYIHNGIQPNSNWGCWTADCSSCVVRRALARSLQRSLLVKLWLRRVCRLYYQLLQDACRRLLDQLATVSEQLSDVSQWNMACMQGQPHAPSPTA